MNSRPRRSALYVPADNPRALEKARGLDADVIILDLEDAVAPAAKPAARDAACAAVAGFGHREVVIRVNAPASPWGVEDLKAAVAARPGAILLPKVKGAADIAAAAGLAGDIALWAMIESPRAVLALEAIAGAGAAALVLGGNDLLKEMGARHMPGRANLAYAMARCVLVARAAGIAVLDGVHNALDDAAGFEGACAQARDFGFDGKTLIHPSQIAPCNAAFTPSAEEAEAARRIVAAFAASPGKGALLVDGRMVERLDAEVAQRVLARAAR